MPSLFDGSTTAIEFIGGGGNVCGQAEGAMTDPMLAKLLRALLVAAVVLIGAVLVHNISDALTLALG
jgi:hypothetical protein